MKKNPTTRFSCTASKQLDFYIRWLLEGGLHGNTRSEVVARMLCDGIRQAVPMEVVRKFTATFVNSQEQQSTEPNP